MRLVVTVTAGSTTALPRIVSLLHKRAVTVQHLTYRRSCRDGDAVEIAVESTPRAQHLVKALLRLVEVLEVRELEVPTCMNSDHGYETSA